MNKAKKPITLDDVPGGHHTCQDNGDGTWNMLDVPIMGELSEGEKGVPFDLGAEWHKAALAKAELRESEGHWAPTHVHHHDKGVETKRAGFLRLRRVGTVTCDGREQSCLYADLLRIPNAIFERIDRAELPYVSVEVASWDEPEIASLALMPDKAPFFSLPMLTTGKKIRASKAVELLHADESSAYAMARAGEGAFILFNLGGPMSKKITKKAPTQEPKEEVKGFDAHLKAAMKAAGVDEKDEAAVAKFKADLSAHLGVKPEAEEADEQEAEEEIADEDEETISRKPVEQGDDGEKDDKIAKLSATVDTLKRKDENRERKDKIKSIVDKSMDALKGRYLSAETKAHIQETAVADLTGKTTANFVKVYLKNVPPDEVPGEEGEEPAFGRRESIPAAQESDAVAKFAAKGADVHARARKIAAEFDLASKTGHVPTSMSLERYLEINMALPPMQEKRR